MFKNYAEITFQLYLSTDTNLNTKSIYYKKKKENDAKEPLNLTAHFDVGLFSIFYNFL